MLGEAVVAKKVHSAFIGTDLVARLEAMGRPSLVICGVLLANSVEATVRNAANLGFSACACRPMPAGRAISAT